MSRWSIRKFMTTGLTAVVAAAVLVIAAPAVDAQSDRYETCSFYGLTVNTGGPLAADAAASLKALSPPNPGGIDNALDIVINAESDVPPIGSRPTTEAYFAAIDVLTGYYGGVCADIDICPLIVQAARDDAGAAEAARLARGITAPSPPGIDSALALIAGVVDESPIHASIDEAQEAIASYFPCGAVTTPAPSPGVPGDVAATCADVGILSIPEGPRAIAAAERLRARGAPNPAGIEAALDVLVQAANFDLTPPPLAEIDAALATIDGYFGGVCANLDRCALVAQIAGTDTAAAQQAASWLRGIETPSPPGIDAALALLAGEIDESPFHDSVAQARTQILDYYPCGISAGGSGGPDLAFTGSSLTAPLSALGVALLAAGAGTLRTRRSLLSSSGV